MPGTAADALTGSVADTTLTVSSRYRFIAQFLSRSSTGAVPYSPMNTGWDADLLEWAHWMRDIRGLSNNTIRVRLDLLQRVHVFAGRPLREVECGHLLRFERMAIAGRSPETRRSYCCHIRAFYRWARTKGYVTEDPSAMLTLPMVPRHLPRPIEETDLATALRAARPKMAAMLVLASHAGLRAVEIAGLEWSDLHREPSGATYLHIRKGKGGKERTVEVGQTVVEALQAHGIKRRGPVFLGADAAPMEARSVSRSANRFLHMHGVDATLHQLRHRYGTVAYQLSQDLRMVQQQMGHASPQTTAGYTRVHGQAAARMVAAMDAMSGSRAGGPVPAAPRGAHAAPE
jgi:site-specific recombinase XerD